MSRSYLDLPNTRNLIHRHLQYSAEAFPLYVRDMGMALATAVTFFLYVCRLSNIS